MGELVKSIIFEIFSIVILVTGVITNAGLEVIGLGAALTAFSTGCLLYNIFKK